MPSLALWKVLEKNLDKGNVGFVVFVELQKAFYTVENDIVL